MGDNFWRIFITLFGIGAAVSFAKSLQSKKPWNEVFSEMIITGVFSLGAAAVLIVFPSAPVIAVVGVGAIGSVLGVALVSQKIQDYLDKLSGKKDS